jgi:quercetin dioxygenase-like cupin family protein
MRLVDFRPDRAWSIDVFGSVGMTQAPITAPLAAGGLFQAACFRLELGGRMGRHPATYPHLFAVVEGTGWVSGADGEPHAIGAGEAVFWDAGEEHEIWTDDGLTMIVIEGADEVQPYEPRPLS